jgi:hypothetical protein
MKINFTLKKILPILMIVLSITTITTGQSKFGIGAYFGGGVLSGNTASVGSFTSSVFIDIVTPLSETIYPRLSFVYTRDIKYILPGTRYNYYPYISGYSLKLMTHQNLSGNLFIEEGAGLAALLDKSLSGISVWDYGTLFSIATGLDLRNGGKDGVKIAIGTEYAITFNNTLAQYFSLHLQAQYVF